MSFGGASGEAGVYVEMISTRKAAMERSGLTAALDYLRAGDTLTVCQLDRLGRSVEDVLTSPVTSTPAASASGPSPASCPAISRRWHRGAGGFDSRPPLLS